MTHVYIHLTHFSKGVISSLPCAFSSPLMSSYKPHGDPKGPGFQFYFNCDIVSSGYSLTYFFSDGYMLGMGHPPLPYPGHKKAAAVWETGVWIRCRNLAGLRLGGTTWQVGSC